MLDRLRGDWRLLLALILAVALIVRLAVIVATPGYEPVFDSGDYVRHAISIAAGEGYPESIFTAGGGPTTFRPPVYPHLLGGVYAVVGEGAGETAGRVLGALAGVLVVYLIYLLGTRIWGRRVGLIAAAVAALTPSLVFLNAALVSEPYFLALMLGAMLAVLAARRAGGDWRWAAFAGALCGLAALTRSNGILLLIPALIGVWVIRPRLSRAALAAPAAVLIAALLTFAPWTARNSIEFGQLVPLSTQGGFAAAGAYNDEARTLPGHPGSWVLPQGTERYGPLYRRTDLDEVELDRELRSSVLEYMREHPGYVVGTTARNVLRTFELMSVWRIARVADERQLGLSRNKARVAKWSSLALLGLALLGAVALLRRPPGERGPGFIWLAPVLMVLAAAWVIANSRYRIPVYPFMALLVAIAIADLGDRLLERRRGTERRAGNGPKGPMQDTLRRGAASEQRP